MGAKNLAHPLALRRRLGNEQAGWRITANRLRAQLGNERFRATWTLGFAMLTEQVVGYALKWLAG